MPVLSQATIRRPKANAPAVAGTARGPRSRSNSNRSGSAPSRCRARVNAALEGTLSAFGSCRSPLVSDRSTDR